MWRAFRRLSPALKGNAIVTTHAALKLFTPFTREAIKDAGFQLVIDEELECLSQVNLKTLRKNILLDSGSVFVDALVRKF